MRATRPIAEATAGGREASQRRHRRVLPLDSAGDDDIVEQRPEGGGQQAGVNVAAALFDPQGRTFASPVYVYWSETLMEAQALWDPTARVVALCCADCADSRQTMP